MHWLRASALVSGTALAVSAAAFAAAPRAGHFAGSTSGQGKTIKYVQDRSIRFTVSHGKVSHLKVGFKSTCPDGTLDTDAVGLSGPFVIKRGRFSGRGHVENGGTGYVTGRFTTPRSASGTIRMRPIDEGEGVEGGPPEQCDSGLLKWSARLR
jgi:hypothetical protein